MRRALSAVLLASCALAYGCGGGGGGDGGDAAEITSANAQQLTAQVLLGPISNLELASVGRSIGDPDVTPMSSARDAAVAAQSEGISREVAGGGISPLATFGPVSESCQAGGSVTLSGDVANPGTGPAALGDQLQADFDGCGFPQDDTPPDVLDGLYAYTIRGLDSSALTLALTLDQFEFADGELSLSLLYDGAATMILALSGFEIEISGSALQVSLESLQLILLDFTTNFVLDPINEGDGTVTGNGSLSSSCFTGELSYEIVEPLESHAADALFSKGELLIMGANDATIRVTVENDVDLLLELDLDGNGTVDATQHATFDSVLESLGDCAEPAPAAR